MVDATDNRICGVDEKAVNLESLVEAFCLNSTLSNKPKIFLVQKNRRICPQSQAKQHDDNQPLLKCYRSSSVLNQKSFPDLDTASDVLVCKITSYSTADRDIQTSFLREYERVSRKEANFLSLPAILKKAEDNYRDHLRIIMPSQEHAGLELSTYDQLVHDLYLTFTG